MNEYHYSANGKPCGPVSKEQLIQLYNSGKVNASTLVWCQGMADWQKLSTVIPVAKKPAVGKPNLTQLSVGSMPDSGLTYAILVTIFCCWPFGIPAIVQAAKVGGLWRSGQYSQARAMAARSKYWSTWSLVLGIISAIVNTFLLVATFH